MTTTHRAEALSIALFGLEAHVIHIEATVDPGPAKFELVGVRDGQGRETRVRVRSALQQLGVEVHGLSICIRLAPEHPPTGGAFDLPIALAVLAAVGRVPANALKNIVIIGELSLTGALQAVRGVLPSLRGAVKQGITMAIVPRANAGEAASTPGTHVLVASELGDIVRHLSGGVPLAFERPPRPSEELSSSAPDMSEIRAMRSACRALEIAAAGGHGILLVGPPGSGKTALARRVPSILPPLTRDEAIEVTAIHSVAGLLVQVPGLMQVRPFRAPHHTVSSVGLVGGGDPVRPGEVSLAHHGVLFLDELSEFRTSVLDSLRQPLVERRVTLSREGRRTTFPAGPLLVGAVNPCPCGYNGERLRQCICSADRIRSYRARLAGPFYDRFDIRVFLPSLDVGQCQASPAGELSRAVRERVVHARAMQIARAPDPTKAVTNSELSSKEVEREVVRDAAAARLLAHTVEHSSVSAALSEKVLRVARTIADLDASDVVSAPHVAEALQLQAFGTAGW